MRKIIAAFDGLKFSESTANHAIFLAKQSGAHLVAVFLEDLSYQSYKIYDLVKEAGDAIEPKKQLLDERDAQTRSDSVQKFKTACNEACINYSLHRDKNIAIQELLHESIYADLVVIGYRETLAHYNEKPPTAFIRDLLAGVHCPVLIVPPVFQPLNDSVLLFDGTPSSMHALKMYSYTLGSLDVVETKVLSVNTGNVTHVPDTRLLKELLKCHGREAEFITLNGDPKSAIPSWFEKRDHHSIVILGAYQRSALSRWLRESLADILMKESRLPLFVAHHK